MQTLKRYKASAGTARHQWSVVLFTAFASATLPFSSSAADGLELWLKGSCGSCHGNRGQGGASSVDFPQGPSLRVSQLDAEGLFEVIGCGIPGTRMYASLIGAYGDHACWGIVGGVPPQNVLATETFTADEVRTLVQFIQTRIHVASSGE